MQFLPRNESLFGVNPNSLYATMNVGPWSGGDQAGGKLRFVEMLFSLESREALVAVLCTPPPPPSSQFWSWETMVATRLSWPVRDLVPGPGAPISNVINSISVSRRGSISRSSSTSGAGSASDPAAGGPAFNQTMVVIVTADRNTAEAVEGAFRAEAGQPEGGSPLPADTLVVVNAINATRTMVRFAADASGDSGDRHPLLERVDLFQALLRVHASPEAVRGDAALKAYLGQSFPVVRITPAAGGKARVSQRDHDREYDDSTADAAAAAADAADADAADDADDDDQEHSSSKDRPLYPVPDRRVATGPGNEAGLVASGGNSSELARLVRAVVGGGLAGGWVLNATINFTAIELNKTRCLVDPDYSPWRSVRGCLGTSSDARYSLSDRDLSPSATIHDNNEQQLVVVVGADHVACGNAIDAELLYGKKTSAPAALLPGSAEHYYNDTGGASRKLFAFAFATDCSAADVVSITGRYCLDIVPEGKRKGQGLRYEAYLDPQTATRPSLGLIQPTILVFTRKTA